MTADIFCDPFLPSDSAVGEVEGGLLSENSFPLRPEGARTRIVDWDFVYISSLTAYSFLCVVHWLSYGSLWFFVVPWCSRSVEWGRACGSEGPGKMVVSEPDLRLPASQSVSGGHWWCTLRNVSFCLALSLLHKSSRSLMSLSWPEPNTKLTSWCAWLCRIHRPVKYTDAKKCK